MPKKGLRMSPVVAQNAELPEKSKPEITVAAAVVILVNHVKCSPLFVLLVAKRPPYRSNLLVINQCIAVIATNRVHAAIGKLLIEKPSLAFIKAKEGFFFTFIIYLLTWSCNESIIP
jgi:uncharacterized membrane protein YecN with MAPEG domain